LSGDSPPLRAAGGPSSALEAVDLAVELGVAEDGLDHRGAFAVELCAGRRASTRRMNA
jgi:hypothetical protein